MGAVLLLLLVLPFFLLLFLLLRALLERIPVSRLDRRSVLITGCDSGFGFDLALRCLGAGIRVFAGCLTQTGLQSLKKRVEESGIPAELVEPFEMDVRSDDSVAKALEFVENKLGPIKVNTLGTIRVTHAFKHLVKRQKESRIVIMASSCGRVALPTLGPYNVSKFAVEAYADTIRTELIMFGVKVSLIEPGFFRTPITNLERSNAILDKIWARTPDSVKQEYGPNFFKFCKRYLLFFLDPARLNPHTEMVVDAYWHAISSAWPRRRCQVGLDMHCLYWPVSLNAHSNRFPSMVIDALTGCQAGLSLLSIYVAASLTPMKFWYVRTHIVQEFSCSLLATSLAVMQFLVFRLANGGGPFLIKGIVLANACQIVQELNMALSAFYTFFYVGRIYDAVEERTSFFTGQESVHVQMALARTVLALSLLFHIGRMLLNAFVLLSLAPRVFNTALTLRVKFKLDSEMIQSDQQWTQTRKRESKWLYSVSGCVLAVAAGHMLLNFGYIWESMIFESLSVATGLSFVFSICLLGAVGFYAFRLLRFCLILSAYISLNLLVTAALLLFAFIQDFFFLATTLDDDKDTIMTTLNTSSSLFRGSVGDRNDSLTMDDSDPNGGDSTLKILLYLADFALSVGTFFIAGFTLRYAVSTLVKTKLLQTQPAGVQRAVRLLRALSLVGVVSAAIEFLLLAELRIGKTATMSHLSVNSSFYDWLLTSAQFVFLFYVTRFERFQALLPVQILQLASVAITTLDLIGQQTDVVQIYVNSVLQFYRVTEALFRRPVLSAEGSASAVFLLGATKNHLCVRSGTALSANCSMVFDDLCFGHCALLCGQYGGGRIGEQQ
uniref:7TM_GPCR_Srx domain-containing protein n=1 Tax=Globodera pallida TaxID=36090 RepID=A0A183CLJ9_GLOPA